MSRVQREISPTGYYHVTLRGNGRQILFEDDADRKRFLLQMAESVRSAGGRIIVWCLMSNHVHVVIDDPRTRLSDMVHDFAGAYARCFNAKTGHVGSVFQGRFHSVAIVSERQLLQTARYVHDNPVRARIADVDEYEWSSFGEYFGKSQLSISDVSVLLEMLGGVKGFLEFSHSDAHAVNYLRCGKRISDADVQAAAKEALGDISPLEIKTMPQAKRAEALAKLRSIGLSWRQLEMLTGIGVSSIRRSLSKRQD